MQFLQTLIPGEHSWLFHALPPSLCVYLGPLMALNIVTAHLG